MAQNRIITYAIHKDDGLVISRVGSELAWPTLQYEDMKPENNFETSYKLERATLQEASSDWPRLEWTKKIPRDLKNRHREFWGLPPIKGPLSRWEKADAPAVPTGTHA